MNKLPSSEGNTIYCTSDWAIPNATNGDYYNRAAKPKHGGVPRNIFGSQEPHSGDAYGGFCIEKNFIEYLEVKLTEPLQKGKNYLVEFYICKAELRLAHVNEFGIMFTDKPRYGYDKRGIARKPVVDFTNPDGYTNTNDWTKLSTVYVAEGYEAAFIIGYFNYDQPKGIKGHAHYYIDDITIAPIEKKTEPVKVVRQDTLKKAFTPKMNEEIELDDVIFAAEKSDLLPSSYAELDKLLDFIKSNPKINIKLEGHTDNSGEEEENEKLSLARAKAVADYLIEKSIDKSRLTYTGLGSTKPIDTNKTIEGRQNNRRVVFILSQ